MEGEERGRQGRGGCLSESVSHCKRPRASRCTFAADFIANTAALAVQMMRNRYDERRVLDEIHKYRSWDLSKGNWQTVKGRVLDRVAQAMHPHTHTTQHRARVQTGPTR